MAFPFVADIPGVDSSLFCAHRNKPRQQPGGNQAGGAATCPFNSQHQPAVPVTSKYPYNNAKNGLPGNGKGGYQAPAPGDTAHQSEAPSPNDIRGPCPGFNSATNNHIRTSAVLLAALGLTLTDGDLVTEKLSISCDATTRTSIDPTLTGSEPGLDGHNNFESDTSDT